MIIYPAIDIQDGQCVRLQQGDFEQVTVFDKTPLEQALSYQAQGAKYIHIVDLDGAKLGKPTNYDVIRTIATNCQIPIQVGGGIRDVNSIETLLSYGVQRVILGTKAVENLEFVAQMVQCFPQRVVVSIDAKNGYVATNGWLEQSTIKSWELCEKLKAVGVGTIIYTDIAKDGMMQGIDSDFYQQLKHTLELEIIASGGVTSLEDIAALAHKGLDGSIIGKALYIGALHLSDAVNLGRRIADAK